MSDDEILVMERKQKKNFKIWMTLSALTAVINLIVLPLSFFIGGMATAAPDSGFRGFAFGFLYVQIIPLAIFLIVISVLIVFIIKVKRSDFMKTFLKLMIIINIIIVPVSIFIGLNAMRLQDGSILAFIYGFLFIQTIPLTILLIGILTLRSLMKQEENEELSK
ncbi:hypothetical protein ACLIBG_13050 [Virgibacillus sp. W0181]|uniref:hypothetical protein n=1 Tax=Virgibacillus sp. W0181 TaxID=3391581 RepID=UPI003F47DFD8